MANAIGIGSLVAGLGGALFGSNAAKSAADTQSNAARYAADQTRATWEKAREDILPFLRSGIDASAVLAELTGAGPGGNPLTAPLTARFTPADLESTPGYQFTLDQGLKGVQNSYAARGLGSSGAALKGATRYATGLAQQTYNDQLSNYLKQNLQTYNMLLPQMQQGLTAGAALTSGAMGMQRSVNDLFTSGANAQAAGEIGSTNSLMSALNPLVKYGMLYWADPNLFKQNVTNLITGPQGRSA